MIGTAQIYQSASTTDPSLAVGFAGAGSIWYQTDTFLMFTRNAANSAWVQIGSVNTPNFGMLPKTGGALSGSILGSTGLVTKDGNTPFSSAPYVTGKLSQAATLADVSALNTFLDSEISGVVAKAISKIGIPSLSTNMLIIQGQAGTYETLSASPPVVSLATTLASHLYGNGVAVKPSDCVGIASFARLDEWPTAGAYNLTLAPADAYGTSWSCYLYNPAFTPPNYYLSGLFNYFIIAINPSA